MIAPIALPAIVLAESVSQAANSWPAVALAIVGLIGTWGTLIIKVWAEGRKTSATNDTVEEIKQQNNDTAGAVKEIKEQVVNDHSTNMRDDLTEGLELMRVAVGYIRTLPTNDQYMELSRRIEAIEQGRATRP